MSKRPSEESIAKMIETRRRLGRRLPRSESAPPPKPTLNPRVPRATGSSAAAMGDSKQ